MRRSGHTAIILVMLGAIFLVPSVASAQSKHRATSKADRLRLTSHADTFRARGGADRIHAGAGNDRIWGDSGNDRLHGELGNDRLVGGSGRDQLIGGPGVDTLDARDGVRDQLIDGGPGQDTCLVDPADTTRIVGCERIIGAPLTTDLPRSSTDPGASLPVIPPVDPGLADPNVLPASRAMGRWTPTIHDTCPKALHERYFTIGTDHKRYPTWHPPTVINPETGTQCSFGHEHGKNPADSEIGEWVAEHLSAAEYRAKYPEHAGTPFGIANEALANYASDNPGTPLRDEDHVGHKIDFANNVKLLAADGSSLGVTCDYFFKLHQGSHSADALGNNVHELIYAMRCSDGAELLSTTLVRFGKANEFNRSCAPGEVANAATTHPYGSGAGERLIADRECIERDVLVGSGQSTSYWSIYENWRSQIELRRPDGSRLAYFDPDFAIFNPARYGYADQPLKVGRMVDACWEQEANGDRANREPCDLATGGGTNEPFEYTDPRSPFNGARREFFLGETEIENVDGPQRWYTDPYGENATTNAGPGLLCQIVSPGSNSARPKLQRRLFGRGSDYGYANGVHAPN